MPPFLFILLLILYKSATSEEQNKEKKDPDSQEVLWESIKQKYPLQKVNISENGHVNSPPPCRAFLKIVAISDTHGHMNEIMNDIPDGDVLIHAGDFTDFGDEKAIREFDELLGLLPHRHKIVISGNHEFGFDASEDKKLRKAKYQNFTGTSEGYNLLKNAVYLHDSSYQIENITFYGSSWHPLKGFPFYRNRTVIGKEWEKIPSHVDVLITHSPPLGHLDLYKYKERWGDYALLRKVDQVQPKFHVFGHIHYEYGAVSDGNTTFINAASKKGTGSGFNPPLVFFLPVKSD